MVSISISLRHQFIHGRAGQTFITCGIQLVPFLPSFGVQIPWLSLRMSQTGGLSFSAPFYSLDFLGSPKSRAKIIVVPIGLLLLGLEQRRLLLVPQVKIPRGNCLLSIFFLTHYIAHLHFHIDVKGLYMPWRALQAYFLYSSRKIPRSLPTRTETRASLLLHVQLTPTLCIPRPRQLTVKWRRFQKLLCLQRNSDCHDPLYDIYIYIYGCCACQLELITSSIPPPCPWCRATYLHTLLLLVCHTALVFRPLSLTSLRSIVISKYDVYILYYITTFFFPRRQHESIVKTYRALVFLFFLWIGGGEQERFIAVQ